MTESGGEATAPGICLLTPAGFGKSGPGDERLMAALATGMEFAGVEVLILTAASQAGASKSLLKQTRALAMRHGKVFLVEDDVDLAVALEAEGTLMGGPDGLRAARKMIGHEAMVGVKTGLSRHDAMEAGEAGADFVALGAGNENPPDLAALADHVAWWAELFEVPSVAFGVRSPEGAAALTAAGADFVALGDPLWDQGGVAAAIAAIAPQSEPIR